MAVDVEALWDELRREVVLVVGLSQKTGLPAAKLLGRQGVRFKVSDAAPRALLEPALAELAGLGIAPEDVFSGPQLPGALAGVTRLVVAPGVPRTVPLVAAALERGLPVEVDLDFLYPFFADKRIVAITGTDGKTTTTTLTGELLATIGPVVVAGNIGLSPFACLDELRAADRVVLEVSSFMLEGLGRFRPNVAAILNVAEDHVERYRSLDEYAAVKCAVVRHCRPGDVLFLNADDPRLAAVAPANVAVRRLSRTRRDGVEACFRDGAFEVGGERYLIAECALRGQQNELNVLTALAIAHEEGADRAAIRDVLGRFRGLRHRLEHVGCFGGVDAYDDSKASNVHAVEAALGNFPGNVVLILGGRDKGLDFTPLRAHAHRLRRLVCYGEHGERIRDALAIPGALYRYGFEDAVACAAAECRPGDALVLSPGCTSWDQFPNYEVRGDAFRALAARHLGSEGRA